MFGEDFLPTFVRRLGVVVVHPNVIEAERAVVVGVRLAVGQEVELVERLAPARVEHADEEFILGSVVARRLREGGAVVRMVGRAPAVAVGLDALIAFAAHAGGVGGDPGQEAGGRVAGDLVGADRLLHCAKVMAVVEDADLVAVPFLAVGGIGFAADMVADTGRGQEVALVGRVDEHLPLEGFSGQHRDLGDTSLDDAYALGAIEPFVAQDAQVEFLNIVLEDLLGHARFKDPHRPLVLVHGHRALALVAELLGLLPLPGGGLLIFHPDAVIEVAGQTADDGFIACIGVAQSAAAEAAEMDIGSDNHHGLPQLLGLDRGNHAGGGAAVDDDVVGLRGGESQ